MMRWLLTILAVLGLALPCLAVDKTVYVDAANEGGTEDGTTPATAWGTLAEALADTQVDGTHTIWMADGTYADSIDVTSANVAAARTLTIKSSSGNAAACIIQEDGENYALRASQNAGSLTLEDLTIDQNDTAGRPMTLNHEGGSVTLTDCIIDSGIGTTGLYCLTTTANPDTRTATLTNCTFQDASTASVIALEMASLTLTNCTFSVAQGAPSTAQIRVDNYVKSLEVTGTTASTQTGYLVYIPSTSVGPGFINIHDNGSWGGSLLFQSGGTGSITTNYSGIIEGNTLALADGATNGIYLGTNDPGDYYLPVTVAAGAQTTGTLASGSTTDDEYNGYLMKVCNAAGSHLATLVVTNYEYVADPLSRTLTFPTYTFAADDVVTLNTRKPNSDLGHWIVRHNTLGRSTNTTAHIALFGGGLRGLAFYGNEVTSGSNFGIVCKAASAGIFGNEFSGMNTLYLCGASDAVVTRNSFYVSAAGYAIGLQNNAGNYVSATPEAMKENWGHTIAENAFHIAHASGQVYNFGYGSNLPHVYCDRNLYYLPSGNLASVARYETTDATYDDDPTPTLTKNGLYAGYTPSSEVFTMYSPVDWSTTVASATANTVVLAAAQGGDRTAVHSCIFFTIADLTAMKTVWPTVGAGGLGVYNDQNSVTGNPQFRDPANGDFRRLGTPVELDMTGTATLEKQTTWGAWQRTAGGMNRITWGD